MVNFERVELMDEYVKRLFIFRIVEASGFCRFIIRKGKIVARNWRSVLYNIVIVITADIGATVMVWNINTSDRDLTTAELVTIVLFSIFGNFLLFQITFIDKHRGPDSIQNSIEIDLFLGAKETEFMRKLEIRILYILILLISFIQVGVVCYLYYLFQVSALIHFLGTSYFLWIFFCYYDFCFCLYSSLFLTCRARYLNLALMKICNMKEEYIPKQSLFYTLFWREKYDDRVTFHKRAESKDFVTAFKMLFQQLRHVERCYEYPVSSGIFTSINGSFVAVQTFIWYIQDSTKMKRTGGITSWAISTWIFIVIFTLLTDMFHKQIDQTKLICAYIQLKPSTPVEMLKLTKDVLTTFEVRDSRISLYNVFFLNTGFVLKLAASTFVYITVQLQVAVSNLDDAHKVDNVTNLTSFALDRNKVKELLFLY